MCENEQKRNRHSWWMIAALIHWLSSFATDGFLFLITEENRIFYMICKSLYLIWLAVFWKKAWGCLWGILKKNPVMVRRVIYGILYGAILTIMLILLWPGIWRTDEFGILGNVVPLQIYWWQHFLTSIFYILSFMMIPIPTGVILIQIILVSAGFGYIAQSFEDRLQIKWGGMLCLIPFCIPSVILFHLYPMRITLYALSELIFFWYIYDCTDKERGKITEKQLIIFALGTALLSNWRSEGIYYAMLLPAVILLFFYKNFSKKQIFLFLISTILLTAGIYGIQSYGLHKERNDAYEMTAYAQSLLPLVKRAYEDGDQDGLERADKVIDVDAVLLSAEEGRDGIDSFWAGEMTSKEYSPEEFAAFKKQYFKWIFRYFNVYLKERTYNFLTSWEQTKSTTDLYDPDNIQFIYFLQSFSTTRPIFPVLRGKLITFMEKKIWCLFEIPIIIMICAMIHSIKKRKKAGLLLGMILLRVPLVFITAPDNYFMYYYPFYLIGSVLGTYILVSFIKSLHS